jgi:hypothetical protein
LISAASTILEMTRGKRFMTPWTKTLTLAAAALCATSTTLVTSFSFAEEAENTAESSEAVERDRDFDIPPSREDAERRLNDRDRNWNRRGYRGCYSYCDEQRDDCMRRYYRGYDDWHRGDRRRWDRRRHGDNSYSRCERRFDFCIDACRDSRWRD